MSRHKRFKEVFWFFILVVALWGCAAPQKVEEPALEVLVPPKKKEISTAALANFCAGFHSMVEGDWNKAVTYLERASEEDPNSERILRYLIGCHLQLGDRDKALVYMRRLSDISSQDFTMHYTLGNLHENEGRSEDAILEYERACRSDLSEVDKALVADALYHLAYLYLRKGEPAKAIPCLKDILKLSPPGNLGKLHCEIGRAYIEAGDFVKAREELELCKGLEPSLSIARLYLALVYEEQGELEKAVVEAEAFVETSPETWLAHAFLANLYERVENPERAELHRARTVEILQQKVVLGSDDPKEHITLAKLLLAENKKEEALGVMERAIAVTEGRKEGRDVHFMLASLYYEIDREREAESELKEVLRIDPDFHEASNFLGYFYAERGVELEEALRLVQKALTAQPQNGAYLDSLGWVYFKQATEDQEDRKLELALEKLLEAAKNSHDPEIYKHIGEVYYSLGKWEKARKQWKKALKEFGAEYEEHAVLREIKEKLERLDSLKSLEERQEDYLSYQ